MVHNFRLFQERRKKLLAEVDSPILLISAFEGQSTRFLQDSTFYYFTGISEPGIFCLIDVSGETTLFVPRYTSARSQWVRDSIDVDTVEPVQCGVDALVGAGQVCSGCSLPCVFPESAVSNVLQTIRSCIHEHGVIGLDTSRLVCDRLYQMVPELSESVRDICPHAATLRRIKDTAEIGAIYDAVALTTIAHETAARMIAPEKMESEVQAAVEYVFIESGARAAFPSIIASGANSTVLHYETNEDVIERDSCVVVDIGARFDQYCADLSRTYPSSGTFTAEQKEIYQIVLEAQTYVASLAVPGYFLRNDEHPERSLHHKALEFFRERSLERYFNHGIGHFLGLNVHDPGDYKVPLQTGDVITIEPGLYLPEQGIGIRIEDDYWVTPDQAICLSESLPKDVHSIEQMVQQTF